MKMYMALAAVLATGCLSSCATGSGNHYRSSDVTSKLRVGMSQEKVSELIGAPDQKIISAGVVCYQYELLGPQRTIPTTTAIYFDRHDRVVKVQPTICSEFDMTRIAESP